jgi:hypothetical protein
MRHDDSLSMMEIHDAKTVDRATFAHGKRRAPTDRLPIPKMLTITA